MSTGRIGLIFVVPGQRETLRVNGIATVNNDPALLEQLAARGKPALRPGRSTGDQLDSCERLTGIISSRWRRTAVHAFDGVAEEDSAISGDRADSRPREAGQQRSAQSPAA